MIVVSADAVDRTDIHRTLPDLNIHRDNEIHLRVNISHVLDEFSHEDYVSLFFLMLDYISPDEFFRIVKLSNSVMKDEFFKLWNSRKFGESMFIELLGTLKQYSSMKCFGTCHHIFKEKVHDFSQISGLWKCLYSMCEDLVPEEIKVLEKELFGVNLNCPLVSAEELFCYAYRDGKFDKNNLDGLVTVLKKLKPNSPLWHSFSTGVVKTQDILESYPMKVPTSTSHSGIAVIINHSMFYASDPGLPRLEERWNSQIDIGQLKGQWESFGFKTEVFNNLTDEAVHEKFTSLAKLDHSSYDAFVACYLSHGDTGIVYASNSKPVKLWDLSYIMDQCSTLRNKPKLFFIQACQGSQVQQGVAHEIPETVRINIMTDSVKESENPPRFSDVYTVISTVPGFVSFRDSQGSWFIRTFVNYLNLYGEAEDIATVMTIVTAEISKMSVNYDKFESCKQIPITSSTLRKKLFFKKRQSIF